MRIVAASVAVSALDRLLGRPWPTSDTYRYDVKRQARFDNTVRWQPAAILPIARFVEATTLSAAQHKGRAFISATKFATVHLWR